MPITSARIQAIIPHRYPMLLVDRIVELEPGVRATGVKAVSAGEPYFVGHYPGYPVMPGVLIVEALAQTGAVGLLSDLRFVGRTPIFAGIDNCRFRRQVGPGDVLRLEVVFTGMRGPIGKGHGRALVDDTVACEVDLTFALIDPAAR
ncbi:MAG: 3-hydroxyacyl-ACP dehydratase FabZ [Chloroflexi bacterium]|nr:3-hydroxyacyl-ACP dehydratase FabZ [Chloroflexota bacterium]